MGVVVCLYILGGWSYVVLVAVWGGFVAVFGGLGCFNGQHSMEAPSHYIVANIQHASTYSHEVSLGLARMHPTMVKAAACNILRHYLKSYIDLMYGFHSPMSTLNIIKIHILPYLRFCRSISE